MLTRTLSVALAIAIVTSTKAGEPYYFPHDLDATVVTAEMLARTTKPGFVFAEFAGTKLVQSHTLLFRASVDDRPFLVEHCVIGSEIVRDGKTEWLLMKFYRHPYGPRVGHTQWTLNHVRGVHSEYSLRRLAARPTNKDIQDYLQWSRWDDPERTELGFKNIAYLCFPTAWRSLTGGEPIQLKGALFWPPKD
jgi:hypothetical protein